MVKFVRLLRVAFVALTLTLKFTLLVPLVKLLSVVFVELRLALRFPEVVSFVTFPLV